MGSNHRTVSGVRVSNPLHYRSATFLAPSVGLEPTFTAPITINRLEGGLGYKGLVLPVGIEPTTFGM